MIAIQTIDASNFVIETDYDTKIGEVEGKIPYHNIYIIALEFNKLGEKILLQY